MPKQVESQQCKTVPREVCQDVVKQECITVPKESCTSVPMQVEEKICQNIPREQCQQVSKYHIRSLYYNCIPKSTSVTALKIPGGFVRAVLMAEWLSNILSRGCKSFFTHFHV